MKQFEDYSVFGTMAGGRGGWGSMIKTAEVHEAFVGSTHKSSVNRGEQKFCSPRSTRLLWVETTAIDGTHDDKLNDRHQHSSYHIYKFLRKNKTEL